MTDERENGSLGSRRQFLRTSATALAGGALAGVATRPVHAGVDETIKIALVGCGARGAGAALQALHTDGPVKLWAMADAFHDRLDGCLRSLERGSAAGYDREETAGVGDQLDVPAERRFVGLDAYRKAIDSGVDVVILAETPGFRPKHFEYAVKAGKHVFMEKPVATDPAGVRRVLAAAEEAKKKKLKVGVGLQRRHQTSYHEALQRIGDGQIGEIMALRCYWNGAQPAKTPKPQGDLSLYQHQVNNWYFFSWLSGDHICEQHVHNIDVCNWIKDAYPREAVGMGGRQVRTGKEYGNIFDHHAVEFTYADGMKMHSQCRQIPGCWNYVAEIVTGTLGVANLYGSGAEIVLQGNKRVWRSARGKAARKLNAYQAEHDALFDAIRNDKPFNEADYAARSTLTAIMGRLATYSGKVVTWDEVFNSPIVLTTDSESWDDAPPVVPNGDGRYEIAVPGVTRVV
jgi:predicted dehydrogenase